MVHMYVTKVHFADRFIHSTRYLASTGKSLRILFTATQKIVAVDVDVEKEHQHCNQHQYINIR